MIHPTNPSNHLTTELLLTDVLSAGLIPHAEVQRKTSWKPNLTHSVVWSNKSYVRASWASAWMQIYPLTVLRSRTHVEMITFNQLTRQTEPCPLLFACVMKCVPLKNSTAAWPFEALGCFRRAGQLLWDPQIESSPGQSNIPTRLQKWAHFN